MSPHQATSGIPKALSWAVWAGAHAGAVFIGLSLSLRGRDQGSAGCTSHLAL